MEQTPPSAKAQPDYLLAGEDLAAFPVLIRLQGDVSADAGAPKRAQLLDFMAGLTDLAYHHYVKLSNSQPKGWIDTLYTTVADTQTSYGCTAPGLYAAYSYYMFCQGWWQGNPDGNDDYGRTGYPPDWQEGGGQEPGYDTDLKHGPYPAPWGAFAGLWKPPGISLSFFNAISSVMNQWGSIPPATLIQTYPAASNYASLERFGMSRFDPSNWTDAVKLTSSLAGISTAQSDTLTTLLKQDTPDPGTWLFLLYLLAAQGNSIPKDQQRAATILATHANSVEYPNDTLINQLVYYILMYWADPLGTFGWTNAKLQDVVKVLGNAVMGQDPASVAVRNSIEAHGKILCSDSAYPMQDPYSPNIGFDQRKTDTLFALDKAWTAVKKSAAS
jgi:hypothetical protein